MSELMRSLVCSVGVILLVGLINYPVTIYMRKQPFTWLPLMMSLAVRWIILWCLFPQVVFDRIWHLLVSVPEIFLLTFVSRGSFVSRRYLIWSIFYFLLNVFVAIDFIIFLNLKVCIIYEKKSQCQHFWYF